MIEKLLTGTSSLKQTNKIFSRVNQELGKTWNETITLNTSVQYTAILKVITKDHSQMKSGVNFHSQMVGTVRNKIRK